MKNRFTPLKDLALILLGCTPLVSLSLFWWRGVDVSAPLWPELSAWQILALLVSLALPVWVMRRLDANEAPRKEGSLDRCDWLR